MAKTKTIQRINSTSNINIIAPVLIVMIDRIGQSFLKNDILRISLIFALSLLIKNKAFANAAIAIAFYILANRLFTTNPNLKSDIADEDLSNFAQDYDLLPSETQAADTLLSQDELNFENEIENFQKDEIYY